MILEKHPCPLTVGQHRLDDGRPLQLPLGPVPEVRLLRQHLEGLGAVPELSLGAEGLLHHGGQAGVDHLLGPPRHVALLMQDLGK